ncbi:MAG: ATP-dependent DNA helicase RecQ [Bacteroidota bacterium]
MQEPIHILKEYWGYDAFRPQQEDIIRTVLSGADCLALLPTGGGKSICFQVPGLSLGGVTLVVSPLIALMKDQVAQLNQRGIAAASLHSGLPFAAIDRLLDNCVYGHTRFLYVSPERLQTEIVQERLKKMPLSLIAVDEAHCVSQWGYDFRPAYLQIAEIRQLVPKVPLIALTATATPEVAQDILVQLQMEEGTVFQSSFARPNLNYVVRRAEDKLKSIQAILQNVPGSSVIYTRSRKKTKELAFWLSQRRISATFYHAGLDAVERQKRQDAWIQGKIRVIVSTNAFGMGIDKPDVRSVIHADVPDNLEAYFQEAGRAGRDGKKAYAVLLHQTSDRVRLEKYYNESYPSLATIRRVYQALGSYSQIARGVRPDRSFDFDLATFCQNFQLAILPAMHALKVLEQAGWIILTDAVFLPAAFKILVNREQLYDYQLRNKQFDRLLKTLLRSYQGADKQAVPLREAQIARFLEMERKEVVKGLQQFHRDQIIDYRPPKNKPQLIFSKERVSAEDLQINQERYQFRKQRHRQRLDALLEYLDSTVCRTQFMAAYFGEKGLEPCGKCDICRSNKKAANRDQQREQWQQFLLEQIQEKGPQSGEYLLQFARSEAQQKRLHEALSYLLQEGFLREDAQGQYRLS